MKLYYRSIDCGDGSVNVDFFPTQQEAEDAEQKAENDGEQMFAENSVSFVELKNVDGKIFYKDYDEKFKARWVEIKQVS